MYCILGFLSLLSTVHIFPHIHTDQIKAKYVHVHLREHQASSALDRLVLEFRALGIYLITQVHVYRYINSILSFHVV